MWIGFLMLQGRNADILFHRALWRSLNGWVTATAQTEDAVAIVDDREAQRVIKTWTPKLEVHGVLWAISRGVQEGRVESAQAYSGLCDQMLKAHEGDEFSALRRPIRPGGFFAWYQQACDDGEL
ncbi:hypothetical protein I6B53_01275 [Schaalia sp. 19OD2882]|uniref:hypothetical protein n=1 Tax=Schaalia sp. 19OD2882 TaxID=2794089 RepID=UPI001C1E94C0|nr:hypothetical protein [Schaalia sp. 19OD2882]QWW19794.1 hypothetical protein I6B53_01275 [Schaalia sp. 19OD2882]